MPHEAQLFILALIICGLLILAGMQRARLHELMKIVKEKQAAIDAMAWTRQDDNDVRVVDDPRPVAVEDWLDAHPGESPLAKRNER
jgi:hypothetical protein